VGNWSLEGNGGGKEGARGVEEKDYFIRISEGEWIPGFCGALCVLCCCCSYNFYVHAKRADRMMNRWICGNGEEEEEEEEEENRMNL
jgi:hypothetical protein